MAKYYKIPTALIQPIKDESDKKINQWFAQTKKFKEKLEKLTGTKLDNRGDNYQITCFQVNSETRISYEMLKKIFRKPDKYNQYYIRKKNKDLISELKNVNNCVSISAYENRKWMFANYDEMETLSLNYYLRTDGTNRIPFLDTLTAGFINDEYSYFEVKINCSKFNENYQLPVGAIEILGSEYLKAKELFDEVNNG